MNGIRRKAILAIALPASAFAIALAVPGMASASTVDHPNGVAAQASVTAAVSSNSHHYPHHYRGIGLNLGLSLGLNLDLGYSGHHGDWHDNDHGHSGILSLGL